MIGLVTIASFSVSVPLMAGIVSFRRLPAAGRWLTGLMLVWLAFEVVAYLLRIQGRNNWLVYMMLSFFEILIVTMFYQSIFRDDKVKTLTTALAWVGFFVVTAEYSIVQSPENVVGILYECIFFLGMGLYALHEMKVIQALSKFKFMNLVIMFFFLGTAVYYASWKFMEEHIFMVAIIAHAYLLLVCYGLFTYGLWKLRLDK